jgi:hypothetical protein
LAQLKTGVAHHSSLNSPNPFPLLDAVLKWNTEHPTLNNRLGTQGRNFDLQRVMMPAWQTTWADEVGMGSEHKSVLEPSGDEWLNRTVSQKSATRNNAGRWAGN